MAHSPLFDSIRRSLRLAIDCERLGISTAEGLERRAELEAARSNRRRFLRELGAAAAIGGIAPFASGCGPESGARTASTRDLARPPRTANVAIVGAGLAGLSCALELQDNGVGATIYEAGNRVGGRQFSLRSYFPGQVAERGGELIDHHHQTLLQLANRYNLARENLEQQPGEVFYYFGGQHYSEEDVVDEFRDFVDAMRDDVRNLSGEITADTHSAFDVSVDNTNLLAYLEGANGEGLVAGPIAKEAIIQAYLAEYGLAPSEQSALNFLLFIHSDRRSKFTPFGVFSDERYHLTGGNDALATGIAGELSGPIELGHRLVRVARTSSGSVQLTFNTGGRRTVTRTHDAVVVAIPFSVLRGVELHSSLGLPSWKTSAIAQLGYGTNAKQMIGFNGRPWVALGSNGASYANLANLQATWETNPTLATAARGILTDYASGARGAALNPSQAQLEAARFLTDLERVMPGAAAQATRVGSNYLNHIEHWPSNPLSLGSYTCYTPGQFTQIHGNEGKPVGNLYFAGEHTDSFYSWQGFMEGAALSGIRAATEVLDDI